VQGQSVFSSTGATCVVAAADNPPLASMSEELQPGMSAPMASAVSLRRLAFRVGRWPLALAVALILAVWVAALMEPPTLPSGAILMLDEASAVLRPDGRAPHEGPVRLSRRWDAQYPGLGGSATYRIELPAHTGPEPMALLFSRVGSQVEVRVNDGLVQRWGQLGDPLFDASKHPVMAVVPAALLHADRPNELRVDVTIQPQRLGGLSTLHYGPRALIEPVYDTSRRWRELAWLVFAVGLSGMGILTGALWLRQRQPMYGWFSLGALIGTLRIVDRAWADIPVPWPMLGALAAMCYLSHMVLMCRFSVLATGTAPRRLERAMDAAIFLGAALTASSFALHRPVLFTLGLCTVVPVSLASLWLCARRAWSGPDTGVGAWLLTLALAGSIAAGLHDLLAVRISSASGLRHTYLQHAMFAFVPIMGWLIAERYSRTAASFHALNAHLAQRVEERERQLTEAFEVMRAQQQDQAVSNERQRIMREIHDGVGSQLVALLNMVGRPGTPSQALREHVQLALDEMRMAIDSMQTANDDLMTVLATLRYRLQSRLEAAGIEVKWDVVDLSEVSELSPNVVMHIQRILLEAFTNVLKHAQATQITVQARLHSEAHVSPHAPRASSATVATISIADDGIGLGVRRHREPADAAQAQGGQGLDNMRFRANLIGATLQIDEPAQGGTRVTLALHLPRTPVEDPALRAL
jgi:signal transduction histidine kinase